MEAADVKQLRTLEQENARLKKLLAERDLAIEVMLPGGAQAGQSPACVANWWGRQTGDG